MIQEQGMRIWEFLKKEYREEAPSWLNKAGELHRASVRRQFLEGFLRSRLVYYPGAGNDGQPIALFNKAHAAHAYIYVDYGVSRDRVTQFATPHPDHRYYGVLGYETITTVEVAPPELIPYGWIPHLTPEETRFSTRYLKENVQRFALLFVFQRLPEYGEEHGAHRFALLYVGADGFATYDALFCQPRSIARPFCLVLQYKFETNWDSFGKGHNLERIALRSRVWPHLLLVSHKIAAWKGYREIEGVRGVEGGYPRLLRTLYRAVESDLGRRAALAGDWEEKPWWM